MVPMASVAADESDSQNRCCSDTLELVNMSPSSTSSGASGRITNLDLVRGVAVLGILVMNAVSFALGTTAYFNISAEGTETWFDWVLGVFGEVFVDQKFMAMFSMLFGAGIVLFADRAAAKGGRSGWLSLWRNALLFVIGFAHGLAWDGDVLVVYALAAPILILVRHLRPALLVALGIASVLLSVVAAVVVQATLDVDGTGLGDYWLADGAASGGATSGGAMSDGVGVFLLVDFFGRAVGMMLLGVALYRTEFFTGGWRPSTYRRIAWAGSAIGLALASMGVATVMAADFAPSVAVVGSVPNTLGTIPASLGFVSVIILWGGSDRAPALQRRLQAVGRMALSNYLSQTVLGLLVFRLVWPALADDVGPTRTVVAGFIVVVWALQLWWSPVWLERFRFGPAEWVWRVATYRRWQSPRVARASQSAEPLTTV